MISARYKRLKPAALALFVLVGIVLATNIPSKSAVATSRRVNVCVRNDFYLIYKRSCGGNIPLSWPADRPEPLFACMVKSNRQIGVTPVPPRCGRGAKRLPWGGYSETTKYITACVDRRSREMFVAVHGRCGKKLKVRWVKSAPYLPVEPSTTTVVDTTTPSTTTTTMAPSCANGRAGCALGDTGPGGGKVFYVDIGGLFDWDYLEAAPSDWNGALGELVNWACATEYGTPTSTSRAIGDGRPNTLSMRNAQTNCAGGSYNAGDLIPGLTFGGKSDWFIPSIGELQAMANENTSLGLGMSRNTYWSSTQSAVHDDYAVAYDLASDAELNIAKGFGAVRPIRAFGASCAYGGTCNLGDIGPGGGRVFFVDSADEFADFNYMELAPSNWNNGTELTGSWCSNDNSTDFGATSYDIGTGQTNFAHMVANCTGIAEVVNAYESTYADLNIDDWFIPSATELLTAFGELNYRGFWTGFSAGWYWSSTESGNNARVLVVSGSYHAATFKSNTAGVVPARAF